MGDQLEEVRDVMKRIVEGVVGLGLVLALAGGCGEDVDVGLFGEGGAGGESATGGDATGGDAAGGAGGSAFVGPAITIHLRANAAFFEHTDGLSGQTPIAHSAGMRKFTLYRDASDPEPVTIFDMGEDHVEVGFNDGDDTVVFVADAAAVPNATYTLARVVYGHVRYRVASTLHNGGLNLSGEFDNMQVLSDGSRVDGELRDSGYYEYVFEAAGMEFPTSGTGAAVPEYSVAGGFSVKFEEGEWAYYFPVNLPVTADLTEDIDVVMQVNMFESFRWVDQDEPEFAAGVFDTTATTFEPVLRFGANQFDVLVE